MGRRARLARDTGTTAGLVGTLAVHLLFGTFFVLQVKTPAFVPRVYAVELTAAPEPQVRRAPEAVERPAEQPRPAPPKPTAKPRDTKAPSPPPTSQPDVQHEAAPRTSAPQAPLPGETPSTGADVVTVKTPGLEFPYPDYLRNIVSQVYRRWDRPTGNVALRAEVSFLIMKDGTVRDIRFVTSSGNFSFDLGAQGAVEAAGNASAFGSLPDGYAADVLPVSFFFTPRPPQ